MEFQIPTFNLTIILPVLLVIGWGVALMGLDLFLAEDKKKWLGWLSLVGLVLALVQSHRHPDRPAVGRLSAAHRPRPAGVLHAHALLAQRHDAHGHV